MGVRATLFVGCFSGICQILTLMVHQNEIEFDPYAYAALAIRFVIHRGVKLVLSALVKSKIYLQPLLSQFPHEQLVSKQ